MSIRFVCEQCQHEMDVPDQLAGSHGTCKHCGHHLTVPRVSVEHEHGGLRLRSAEAEPPRLPAHLLASEAPLHVRPADAPPRRKPEAVSDPDDPPAAAGHASGRRHEEYAFHDAGRDTRPHSSAGPPPLLVNLPTLTARFIARHFLALRNWLYVVSVGSLVVVLLGYLYQSRLVLHLGAALVIASNISMLVVGIAYLVTLPFKESFWTGLANVLIPFYAVYYWVTRWSRMKRPVLNTVGSFLPIALVALAYVVYEDAPAVEQAAEKEFPVLEERVEKLLPGLEKQVDRAIDPVKDSAERALHPGRDAAAPQDDTPTRNDAR